LKEIDINAELTNIVEKEFAGLHSGGGCSFHQSEFIST
jgi:hypothetical protein